jgi:hypothetical protein
MLDVDGALAMQRRHVLHSIRVRSSGLAMPFCMTKIRQAASIQTPGPEVLGRLAAVATSTAATIDFSYLRCTFLLVGRAKWSVQECCTVHFS